MFITSLSRKWVLATIRIFCLEIIWSQPIHAKNNVLSVSNYLNLITIHTVKFDKNIPIVLLYGNWVDYDLEIKVENDKGSQKQIPFDRSLKCLFNHKVYNLLFFVFSHNYLLSLNQRHWLGLIELQQDGSIGTTYKLGEKSILDVAVVKGEY